VFDAETLLPWVLTEYYLQENWRTTDVLERIENLVSEPNQLCVLEQSCLVLVSCLHHSSKLKYFSLLNFFQGVPSFSTADC
jgi:hypothetical protein